MHKKQRKLAAAGEEDEMVGTTADADAEPPSSPPRPPIPALPHALHMSPGEVACWSAVRALHGKEKDVALMEKVVRGIESEVALSSRVCNAKLKRLEGNRIMTPAHMLAKVVKCIEELHWAQKNSLEGRIECSVYEVEVEQAKVACWDSEIALFKRLALAVL